MAPSLIFKEKSVSQKVRLARLDSARLARLDSAQPQLVSARRAKLARLDSARLAIFDIDGTIFRSSLLIELINELVHQGIFPQKARGAVEKEYLAWFNRRGHYDDYINKVVEVHHKYIGGCREKDILRAAKIVIAFQKNRVYRFTRDLIRQLKEESYRLVAISGSPSYMVKRFASYFGFDASFGHVFEIKKGIFTGRVLNNDSIYHKERVLRDYLLNNQLNADLKNSIAVGDTESDIPMLSMVGRPIAFNPHRTFAEYAKKKKYTIVVERKDVIYEIKNCVFRNF